MKEFYGVCRINTIGQFRGDVHGVKNHLKEIRMKEYMMSSTEFAKYLGEKLSTYSKWENGDSTPTLQRAYEIAKILKKELKEVWYEE